MEVEQVILGAGLFGLFGADLASRRGWSVALVDPEPTPMTRASFANQARIHLGYHYPRSVGTALQSIAYRDRFVEEFAGCVNNRFSKVYAIARFGSMTSAEGFERFCRNVEIPAVQVDPLRWFRSGSIEAAFLCDEASFDSRRLRREMLGRLDRRPHVHWRLGTRVQEVDVDGGLYELTLTDGSTLRTPRVLNATYAAMNGVLAQFGVEPLAVHHELCELALGKASPELSEVGITVMDGAFFSVMPFGQSGLHSLSAVDYTPHHRSTEPFPSFPCQERSDTCRHDALDNCGTCPVRPPSLVDEMWQLAGRFLRPELSFEATSSILAVRPVLQLSNVDDSRPTLVQVHRRDPDLVSVLSGKINTIYDLEHLW
ncbi:MAG: FAD-dependent oxidoreductase [Acidimicrobiales bacterium]